MLFACTAALYPALRFCQSLQPPELLPGFAANLFGTELDLSGVNRSVTQFFIHRMGSRSQTAPFGRGSEEVSAPHLSRSFQKALGNPQYIRLRHERIERKRQHLFRRTLGVRMIPLLRPEARERGVQLEGDGG